MTIGDRIIEKLSELGITQKEFARRAGILQSTVSEWKVKHTNPSAEKIMSICRVLDVTPEWLLSGIDTKKGYRNRMDWFIIDRGSEQGIC